jgi:hypothetical protein
MRIATIDLETDPFQYQREPAPFAAGFYDGENYQQFWGDDCVKQLLTFLKSYSKSLVIYAHNGGKFDFWYLAHALAEPLLFIDSRLVKAKLFHHEVRDSLKILPVPLAAIQKDEINYELMERGKREKHKTEILKYLESDCRYLYDAVSAFIMRFGDVLTVGGAAIKELSKHYKIPRISPNNDSLYRSFFHGGRCEVFEIGEIRSKKKLKLYDVNSLYPYCEASFEHPIGTHDEELTEIPDAPFFLAHICARSKGALPVRTKNGLTFPHGHVESFCTSHELRMAQKLKLVEITQIIKVYAWNETTTFEKFVNQWSDYKIDAEKRGDSIGRTIGKLIPNNAYGKFAQDPNRFKEFKLFDSLQSCIDAQHKPEGALADKIIGSVPATITPRMYKNVAVAGSITGAGRAVWLHAFASAERPVCGDTDSLWCEDLPLELDQYKLGAWKLEATADRLYVAGKKMYAAWNEQTGFYKSCDGKMQAIKMASKGVRMKPEDIARVANGEILTIPIDAPSLRIGREAHFIARKIARTAILS